MTDQTTTHQLVDAPGPTPLRWGLNDVMWGDDDSVTVLLSGPGGEPFWLELDLERAAVLREDLAGPPADQTTPLRDRIAAAVHPLLMDTLPEVIAAARAREAADVVLAVLPAPVDRAALVRACAAFVRDTYSGEWADDAAATLESDADKIERGEPCSLLRLAAVLPATTNPGTDTSAENEDDELVCVDMCGSCDACGMEPFGTPAEGWREAARFLRRTARASSDRQGALHGARLIEAELRRVADETAATETQAESCAHCGQPIRRVTGTLAAWWVHDPGGNTVCDWARAAASPRATPKRPPMDPVHILGIEADAEPAAGARQDGAQR